MCKGYVKFYVTVHFSFDSIVFLYNCPLGLVYTILFKTLELILFLVSVSESSSWNLAVIVLRCNNFKMEN